MPIENLTQTDAVTYSQIVSLGARCQTTHNIRRHFNHSSGFPFDWWITPLEGLLAILSRPDAEWLYQSNLLERIEDGLTVIHRPTGIQLHHEFPRENGNVVPNYLDFIEKPKARTAALFSKLLALNDNASENILFVREGDDDARLAQALGSLFGNIRWRLASLPKNNLRDGPNWKGDASVWDLDLGTLNARLVNPTLRPFDDSMS